MKTKTLKADTKKRKRGTSSRSLERLVRPDWWNWTQRDGRSNSSMAYGALAHEIERLIRDSAHNLIAGQAHGVGLLIAAQIAHSLKFVPSADSPV